MWSGPRNLSTAMMYSFAARGDCAVVDEPFYATYLALSGLNHPLRDRILAAQSTNAAEVVQQINGPAPAGLPHFYQKHMTQHMVPDVPRSWMQDVTNIFLIRHPARVIASYAAKRGNPTLMDIGFVQQAELYEEVSDQQSHAVVIDSTDIRKHPEKMLKHLCHAIDLPYTPKMLVWPRGGHSADGCWAEHWYGAVWNSTGFASAEGPLPQVPAHLQDVLNAALPHYQRLKDAAL